MKFKSAKHKREWETYQEWLTKHTKEIHKTTKHKVEPLVYSLSVPNRNVGLNIKSHGYVSAPDGTTKHPDKVYTGDKMLGVGTLHKSNGIPIFSSEEATDISKMRR